MHRGEATAEAAPLGYCISTAGKKNGNDKTKLLLGDEMSHAVQTTVWDRQRGGLHRKYSRLRYAKLRHVTCETLCVRAVWRVISQVGEEHGTE